MSYIIKLITQIVLFSLLLSSPKLYAQANSISKNNFRTELILLKGHLENHHPNLYTFSSPLELDSVLNNITVNLPDRISMEEAFQQVAYLASNIQDGHALVYPSEGHLQRFYNEGPLFPIDVFYDGKKLNVIGDYSIEKIIPLGSEIKSINNTSVNDLYQFMVHRLPRDGNNMQYPIHLFYKFFPAYYSFFFGFPDSFRIEYIDEQKKLETINIAGLTRDNIKSKREELNKDPNFHKAISLEFDDHNQLAILTIKTFDNTLTKTDYKQNFKKEIKQAFKTIAKKEINNLAIDLRDNQGGDLSNGSYLLNQISNKRIQFLHSWHKLKIDPNTKKRILKKKINLYKFVYPTKFKSYKGDVFLFTNGGSFSCSAMVANTFKNENLGVIVGEMTGGSSVLNSGGPNKMITMPYSKIIFTIPRTKFQLNELESLDQLGVTPNIEVKDHYGRFLGEEDLYLMEVLKVISGK